MFNTPTPYCDQACGDCGRSYYSHMHYPMDEACGYFVFRQDWYDLCKEIDEAAKMRKVQQSHV